MGKPSKKLTLVREAKPASLGMLIHDAVRVAIERAVEEELEVALGARPYERAEERHGYRNGTKTRTLSGPTGPAELTIPRATLFKRDAEWSSKILPRYQRRLPELNEAILATYLSGGNTRRLKGALRPLLKKAPLSKSAVSRVIGTLKGSLDEWRKRSLDGLEVIYLYLDAFAVRVRSAGKVTSTPILAAVAVLADGTKQLVSLEMCSSESQDGWKGFLDDLVQRKISAPVLCVIDGNAGLRSAIRLVWPKSAVQRCVVHKLRNIERKAPKHALEEIKEDFHRIVYAGSEAEARQAYTGFQGKWRKSCPGVVTSLEEAGDELLTYFTFPKSQWKTIRTTNVIERLNGEFRRRVKTQASLPSEDSALVLLFSLIASGQIRLRKLDGFEEIAELLSKQRQAEVKATTTEKRSEKKAA